MAQEEYRAHFNGSDRELLIRLDERTRAMSTLLETLNHEQLDLRYVTRPEFGPVSKLAYGAAGVILTAVLVGIVSLVLR